MAMLAPLMEAPLAAQQELKRLTKGTKRKSGSELDGTADLSSDAVLLPPKRPKTGLKLKIKFGGGTVKAQAVVDKSVAVAGLGVPADQLLPPGPLEWKSLRDSPSDEESLPSARGVQPGLNFQEIPGNELFDNGPVISLDQHRLEARKHIARPVVADFRLSDLTAGPESCLEPEPAQELAAVQTASPARKEDKLNASAGAEQVAPQHSVTCAVQSASSDEQAPQNKRPAICTLEETAAVDAHGRDQPEAAAEEAHEQKAAGIQPAGKAQARQSEPAEQQDPTAATLAHQSAAVFNQQPVAKAATAQHSQLEEALHTENAEAQLAPRPDQASNAGSANESKQHLAKVEAAPAPSEAGAKDGHAPTARIKDSAIENAREVGEVSPARALSRSTSSSSSSSSSSESSGSDSDTGGDRHRSRKRRRSVSRSTSRSRSPSREPGEHSDDEYRSRSRHWRDRSRSRSRYYDRDYNRERQPYRGADERRYERSRDESSRRFSREQGERRHERNYNRAHRDSRRSPESRDPSRSRHGDRELKRRSTREPSPSRRTSRLGNATRATQAAEDVRKPRGSRSASLASEEHGKLIPTAEPGAQGKTGKQAHTRVNEPEKEPAAIRAPTGFADAWNMLYGSGKEDIGTEANIDELHTAATKAKHRIDSIAKGNNGKYTLENLVALMRESYIKYMHVCALWEVCLRQQNAVNPNRTRAKLADEGGVYPGTVNLMRQVANDARSCPANSEACKLLRILAERLMAIMQMRIMLVQRGKVQQDRMLLLACKGAPRVDTYGRRLPGSTDAPGETFQRPSPTDSNASNNTGEQSLNPSLAYPSQPGAPTATRPSPKPGPIKGAASMTGRAAPTAALQTKGPAKGGTGKPGQPGRKGTPQLTPQGTPTRSDAVRGGGPAAKKAAPPAPRSGRDDAWVVEPPSWEIPPAKFEHETRSWMIFGGVATYAGQLRNQQEELSSLMQVNCPHVREAAGMLGFLDMGLGTTSTGVVLQLSSDILDLVLKIAASGPSSTPATAVPMHQ